MNRTRVQSSNLVSIGYDPGNKILEVEFHTGAVYQYFDVPEYIYSDLLAAVSVGRYFEVYVKRAGFRYRKIK